MNSEGILLAETHFLASKLLQPKILAMIRKRQPRGLPHKCTVVCTCPALLRQGVDPFALHASKSAAPCSLLCWRILMSLCSSSSHGLGDLTHYRGQWDPDNVILRQTNRSRMQAKSSRKGWRNSRMRLRVKDKRAICIRHSVKPWHTITPPWGCQHSPWHRLVPRQPAHSQVMPGDIAAIASDLS